MKLKCTTKSGFKLQIMNSLIECLGGGGEGRVVVRLSLTWLDCKLRRLKNVL